MQATETTFPDLLTPWLRHRASLYKQHPCTSNRASQLAWIPTPPIRSNTARATLRRMPSWNGPGTFAKPSALLGIVNGLLCAERAETSGAAIARERR